LFKGTLNLSDQIAFMILTFVSSLRVLASRETLASLDSKKTKWPAPGSEDTELGVLMELEVGHGETEVYPRVQA
jgi:hypothetical protein